MRRIPVWLRTALLWAAVGVAMALLVAWLSGVFQAKVSPIAAPQPFRMPLPPTAVTSRLELVEVPVYEEAIGTIRAVQEIEVSARILARIRSIAVTAGQAVRQGDVLVELEAEDLEARRREADAAVAAVRETEGQARRELERTRDLHARQIASDRDLERATTALQNAAAELERATQAAVAAQANLAFAVLRSPIDGVVVDKRRQVGDTAVPGQPLLTLYDPTRMQLVAAVREGLISQLRVGGEVPVRIDALGLDCHGTVAEIVPQAAAGSRAFDVKITGPCPDGVYSGMFGRLSIGLGSRKELHVPLAAVRSFGQVDMVFVVGDGGVLQRRFVVLGEVSGDRARVLSGLAAGEVILADARQLPRGGSR